MALNKQSNLYTIVYIFVLVVIVGAALAFISLGLHPRQQDNVNADKMRQILASVRIVPADQAAIKADFRDHIVSQPVVNQAGDVVGDDAFSVNVQDQSKLPADRRQLPVYVCALADGSTKYILPVYGSGLWGPIWGYVAVDADGSTIYGAYFAHQSETPGLGAEIAKPAFSDQFDGKQLFKGAELIPVEVIKAGQKPYNPNADYVDGVSGGTITSKGVSAMMDNCIAPYQAYLSKVRRQNAAPAVTLTTAR